MARPTPTALVVLLLTLVLLPPLAVTVSHVLLRVLRYLAFSAQSVAASSSTSPDALHYLLAQVLTIALLAPAFGIPLPGGEWALELLDGAGFDVKVADGAAVGRDAAAVPPIAPAREPAVSSAEGEDGHGAEEEIEVDDETPDEKRKRELLATVAQHKANLLAILDRPVSEHEHEDGTWQLVADVDNGEGKPRVKVFKNRNAEWNFKLFAEMTTPLNPSFDYALDVRNRTEFDKEMTESGRVVEELDRYTRIDYFRTKAMFPTSARDAVVLAHNAILPPRDSSSSHSRYLQLTLSCTHPSLPPQKGIVRMQLGMGGGIMEVIGDGTGARKTRLIALADLNPGGSVPGFLAKFIASQAVPASYVALDAIIASRVARYTAPDSKLTLDTPEGSVLLSHKGFTAIETVFDPDAPIPKKKIKVRSKTNGDVSKGKIRGIANGGPSVSGDAHPTHATSFGSIPHSPSAVDAPEGLAKYVADTRAAIEYAMPFLTVAGVAGVWAAVGVGVKLLLKKPRR
ncbi:Bet v1-like protein [Gonapodya prolifera JEL478]|uniref:Bet v1-like protein n=1 Tax=Gonapodya prolifera (strain JEL478) TaxID=1344416 RepID=A0A139AB87_GONPJ|nr:Bet v1-like protein [Gonapodya prolifera JEL478]|eukprot:KXS14091.1 Bet v1-like protein [Gonapodya prolifera JEL478]